MTLRDQAVRHVVATSHAQLAALDDTCRGGPCLVLMSGATPLGSINAGGWDASASYDFESVDIAALCAQLTASESADAVGARAR